MKRLLASIFALCFVPAIAFSQAPPFIIQTPGASINSGANVGSSGSAVIDDKGQQYFNTLGTPIPISPSLAQLTPVAMITIVPTAVPTAFGTPQFANSAALKTITVDNSTGNVEIWCAYDGLTAASFRIPPGSVYVDNFAARGNIMSGAVGCIHPANTPSAGTVAIYGSK